jgi:hypothetical protein
MREHAFCRIEVLFDEACSSNRKRSFNFSDMSLWHHMSGLRTISISTVRNGSELDRSMRREIWNFCLSEMEKIHRDRGPRKSAEDVIKLSP